MITPAAEKIMIRAVAIELCQSERGRRVAKQLLDGLRDQWSSLDMQNQKRVIALLTAAWGGFRGSTVDAIEDALHDWRCGDYIEGGD